MKKEGKLSTAEFEAIKSDKKRGLPVVTFHASFADGERCNSKATPSGLCILDLDHMDEPREFFRQQVEPHLEDLGIVFAHITPSCEGLRLVFKIPPHIYKEVYEEGDHPDGRELAAAQAWMADRLGLLAYDEHCKDYARCSFLVPEDYNLYLDEVGLFSYIDVESLISETASGTHTEQERVTIGKITMEEGETEPMFGDVAYSRIIDNYFKLTGGKPQPGERNDKLHKLALHLRYICDDDATLMQRVIPSCGLPEAELSSIIRSALKAKRCSRSQLMQKAIDLAKGVVKDDSAYELGEMSMPPQMPETLPRLIQLLVSNTPDEYKAVVANCVFAPLASYLFDTKFEYIDKVYHEATIMQVLVAGTGVGKECITQPINHILKRMREQDDLSRQKDKEWKEECNSRGANKDKPLRPNDILIQEINPDITHAAFVQRTQEAKGHFLYSKMNEIEQLESLKGNGRSDQHMKIICYAFDPDNRYGQDRVGTQSVTETICVRYNFNASTTKVKAKKFFARALTDGPLSRINFILMPDQPIGTKIPRYGAYTETFNKELEPFINNLCNARGVVRSQRATELAEQMVEQHRLFAIDTQDRVYENLSRRANIIAWLKGYILFVANGYMWESTFDDFIRWSYEYDMWSKMELFGADIEKADKDTSAVRSRGDSMLNLMPSIFTLDDVVMARSKYGKSEVGAVKQVNHWVDRGKVIRLHPGKQYQKC